MTFALFAKICAAVFLGGVALVVLACAALAAIADRKMRREDEENPGWNEPDRDKAE